MFSSQLLCERLTTKQHLWPQVDKTTFPMAHLQAHIQQLVVDTLRGKNASVFAKPN